MSVWKQIRLTVHIYKILSVLIKLLSLVLECSGEVFLSDVNHQINSNTWLVTLHTKWTLNQSVVFIEELVPPICCSLSQKE